MSWQVAIFLRILFGFGVSSLLVKWLSRREGRTALFFFQFVFAFCFSLSLAFVSGDITFDVLFVGIALLGAFNTVGTYFQWKAVAISQSRNALFTFWDDVIAIALSWSLLHEGRYLTTTSSIGIMLSLMALGLFLRHAWRAGLVLPSP